MPQDDFSPRESELLEALCVVSIMVHPRHTIVGTKYRGKGSIEDVGAYRLLQEKGYIDSDGGLTQKAEDWALGRDYSRENY